MQLFTTGLVKLNMDGTEVKDNAGNSIRVYTNLDIVEYARVWTGFDHQPYRGNIELVYRNRIDPMRVNPVGRDVFPKMGLDHTYVGDHYPLCADLPYRPFLKKGSIYRLLASSRKPELQDEDPEEWNDDTLYQTATLTQGGSDSLFAALCGSTSADNNCTFPVKVELQSDLPCHGIECNVDTLRTVEVANGIFYEYIRPPCVYQAFYSNPQTIIRKSGWNYLSCGDPRTQVASSACCSSEGSDPSDRLWMDQYWGETLTLTTAQERCASIGSGICSISRRPSCAVADVGYYCEAENYFWSSDDTCSLWAKIDSNANVAIVHTVSGRTNQDVHPWLRSDSKTFFRVDWDGGDATTVASNCDAYASCQQSDDNVCMCRVTITDTAVFTASPPTRTEVLESLHIGAFDPGASAFSGANEESAWYNADSGFDTGTIFRVVDDNGSVRFRKNVLSMVNLVGTGLSFRNPVHFIHAATPMERDVNYETDAALEHYFKHQNTAPFLTIRLAQRFGISNPSPRYINECANAFRRGTYAYTMGSGKYGDLTALVSCILLDREARDPILDADPSHGAFKEPLIKLMGLMRSLEFQLDSDQPFVELENDVDVKIGQMAHAIPNVFSFFLPEYKPNGPVSFASLTAPEAQVITSPRIIETLNGFGSLVKFGLSPCFGGFKVYTREDNGVCDNFQPGGVNAATMGSLSFTPTDTNSDSAITDELADLLSSGRLPSEKRQIINDVISNEPDVALKVIRATQLILYSPEFHTLGITRLSGLPRPDPPAPVPSTNPYKALVYVLLRGGVDSYNMLAPHTCSQVNGNGDTLLEQYYNERTSLAIESWERSRVIDAADQPCTQFVVHEQLEVVERLYNDGDLAFFANAGVINKPVNKDNYYQETKSQLFSHNSMQEEAQTIDPYEEEPGTGILGRMCDILNRDGYSVAPFAIQDASVSTLGAPGFSVDSTLVSAFGTHDFDDKPVSDAFDAVPPLNLINDPVTMHSSLYGKTWSDRLTKALADNTKIKQALTETNLAVEFDTDTDSRGLETIATLIGSHEFRGTDRDAFFVQMTGWDFHSGLKDRLEDRFASINNAFSSFEEEMKAQGRWDDVTVVIASDFARTLTANTGDGSDHAWGGHYFVMGGSVKGGQIFGDYPADISNESPLNIGRGRIIPTMSWESILNGLVEWMGVSAEDDLNYCMPNRIQTGTQMFAADDIFE